MNILFFSLLGNAFLLGFRHGIEWDHIAAIMDIVGSSTSIHEVEHQSLPCWKQCSVSNSLLYALGHAAIVLVLGAAALMFAANLPKWLDPIMERVVGYTLLALGLWIFYSLIRFAVGKEEFKLVSRWMLIFAWCRSAINWLMSKLSRKEPEQELKDQRYGPRMAFGVGMIHGIGAETGSQLLLLAAVSGAASQAIGIGMLFAFVLGMIISNTLVAILSSTGFISSTRLQAAYVTVGVFVGSFSLFVGSFFALGQANLLPDLQHLLGA